jgi:alpha-beta hydrolase superfamily lysophospholipase
MTRFVLVRGLAREAGHWQRFDRALLERLPEAVVEHHDLPGNGARWRERSPIDTASMAAQLREQVWSRSREPVVLVAISLGAMVCLDWRQRWRADPLLGLVAINTSIGGLCRPWQRLQIPALISTLQTMALRDAVARERAILELTTSDHRDDLELARRHAALHDARPIARANVLRQMLAAARFRAEPVGSGVPILLLSSAVDRMVDPECSRRIAEAFATSHSVHDRAGHDLTLDDPSWCAERIATWLVDSVCRSRTNGRQSNHEPGTSQLHGVLGLRRARGRVRELGR